MCQIITSYTLKLYNIIRQLYLNKAGKNKSPPLNKKERKENEHDHESEMTAHE